MKILNLKISDKDGNNLRDIRFNEDGASFIYGNVAEKLKEEETSNSIGKSTLINMIDFCFGSQTKFKKGLYGVSLEALVKHEHLSYKVLRKIGSNGIQVLQGNIVNENINDVDSFISYFDLDRNKLNLQFIKTQKRGLISQYNQSPAKVELVAFLSLLNFVELPEKTHIICDLQEKISTEKKALEKNLEGEGLESINRKNAIKELDRVLFTIKDKMEIKKREEKYLLESLQNLKVSENIQHISEEHAEKTAILKRMVSDSNLLKREIRRIEKSVSDSIVTPLSLDKLNEMFIKCKVELPGHALRQMDEIASFHKTVIEGRNESLHKQLDYLQEQMSVKEKGISAFKREVNELGDVLSKNNAYQEALEIYRKFSNEMQALKFDEGKYSILESGNERYKAYNKKLLEHFNQLNSIFEKNQALVLEYREFVNNLIKKLYGENKTAFLKIFARNKHEKNKPVAIDLTIDDDAKDGGVGQVKNNVIDYLLFYFNTQLEILVQDSSAFAKIDTRQICTMLNEAHKLALEKNKQCIIAINKYELGLDEQSIKFVESQSIITLSEADILMKERFE